MTSAQNSSKLDPSSPPSANFEQFLTVKSPRVRNLRLIFLTPPPPPPFRADVMNVCSLFIHARKFTTTQTVQF